MTPLLVTLTFCAAGAALAVIASLTAEPIAAAEYENKMRAVRTVLPEFDDSLLQTLTLGGEDERREVFVARDAAGDLVGIAIPSASRNGYGGELQVMVGIVPDGDGYLVNRIETIRHTETPGLGTKVTAGPTFLAQFEGVSYDNFTFAVSKDDPGQPGKPPVDGVTGATISSRAVTEAVRAGFDFVLNNIDSILSAEGDGGGGL